MLTLLTHSSSGRPLTQTPSHTQFNRSLSRQSAKRLLLALLSLICNGLFVNVTFPAVHMSSQAMSPIFHREGTLPRWLCLCSAPPDQAVDSGTRHKISCCGFKSIFLSIFFRKCGLSCLLAPPVHLILITHLFWAWSESYASHTTTTHTHHPYLAGDPKRRIFQETKLQQAGEICGCLKVPRMNQEGGNIGDVGWTEPSPRGYCKNKAIWLHLQTKRETHMVHVCSMSDLDHLPLNTTPAASLTYVFMSKFWLLH